jgi:hypothetical protein
MSCHGEVETLLGDSEMWRATLSNVSPRGFTTKNSGIGTNSSESPDRPAEGRLSRYVPCVETGRAFREREDGRGRACFEWRSPALERCHGAEDKNLRALRKLWMPFRSRRTCCRSSHGDFSLAHGRIEQNGGKVFRLIGEQSIEAYIFFRKEGCRNRTARARQERRVFGKVFTGMDVRNDKEVDETEVYHIIPALFAYNSLNSTNSALLKCSTSFQRLRINGASDDCRRPCHLREAACAGSCLDQAVRNSRTVFP